MNDRNRLGETTPLTIILPHKRNPGNDDALRIALDCLFTHTVNDFHLLIDAATDQPLYERIHRLVLQATTECVVYWSSDIFCAAGWDVPMLNAFIHAPQRRLVFGVVAEPGVLGVFAGNVGLDFGKRPQQWQRAAFDAWAASKPEPPPGYGFPVPLMFPRSLYLQYDAPALDQPDFFLRDDEIIDRMVTAQACVRVRVSSYFYHLQRFSDEAVQQRADRG